MSLPKNVEELVKDRFESLFLDIKMAKRSLVIDDKPKLTAIELEQSKTARALLHVEKQAIQKKDLNEKSNLDLLSAMGDQVNAAVEKHLKESLEDTELLYSKVMGIDHALPKLLDLACTKAATISKIEPLATELPWLYSDLMKFANKPSNRRTDQTGKPVLVETLRVGLNIFGLENLTFVLTYLAFKRSLPQITDPYPEIKHRIWEEALATAISCKQIASVVGVNQYQAFCLGMFHMMGKVVVTKLYFRLFEREQRKAVTETQKALKHNEHTALTRMTPSGPFLNHLIDQYALDISAKLIDNMSMRRVFISLAMHETANDHEISSLSPLALVLKQGNAYAQYRMLKEHNLIDLQQSKDFIRTLKMPKGALELLRKTNLRALDLSINNN
ncbi:HDOD domain-containing protein [uncultured Paraglaciecola sp.]|uniref:HDOD domain-containing protein n=1 Tax=uncultured Paraglaciecola sp. TaxID=1765024 RepID=UPI00260CC600|nr:HDOD domain-containing protein [uncultured Paraglaciecola sp.]